jgi:hypothetical protein
MSIASVLTKLESVLREATNARGCLHHTVIPALEALYKGQAELLEIAHLTLRQDTDAKTLASWKQIADERRGDSEKLRKVRALLSANGCDCQCGCASGGHEDDCQIRCLACRIVKVVGE